MVSKPDLQQRYIFEFYQALDCPRALTAWLLYSHKEHRQLAELEFNPHHYNSVDIARTSLAATKFLSKAEFLSIDIDKRSVALDKFRSSETACAETNSRIRSYDFSNCHTVPLLNAMERKIDQILGSFTAEELVNNCDWGPGATTSIPRRSATQPTKFQIESGITVEAYDFIQPWFRLAYPSWDIQPDVTKGYSKIVTVPKNAKTDRTIAIEPGLNLWFQKGIGFLIRRRLAREGIDLNHQSHNQQRSRVAAKFNHLATVDFSSASDTIATALVEEILPHKWLMLVKAFRSSYGLLDGKYYWFNKISSMGNGFTFELESLIFYVLAVCVCERLDLETSDITVFGDDVILPSAAYDLFAAVSADLGFEVNKSKSYSDSYYRESCGEHWWGGTSIKPIFQKENLNGKTPILKAANNVRRLAHSYNSNGCDRRLRRCWSLLAGALGLSCPRISEGYGDVGLIENFDGEGVVATRAKRGFEGYNVRVWALQAVKREFDGQGLLLYKLKSIGKLVEPDIMGRLPEPSIGNDLPMPIRTKHAKLRVLVPRWYDLGPWV